MKRLLAVSTPVVVLWPGLAAACAVCFSSEGSSRETFIWTTAFLTALPLVAIGTGVWWIRRKLRQAEAAAESPTGLV